MNYHTQDEIYELDVEELEMVTGGPEPDNDPRNPP